MEPETRSRIEKTVLEILKSADMDEMTEFKVRQLASGKLGINLSAPDYKRFVRQVVETFLQSTEEPERQPEPEPDRKKANTEAAERESKEEEEEEVEEDRGKSSGVKEYDDDGDLIICRLSDRRRVTIQDFRGKTLVSIREFYRKDGKELPSSKGRELKPCLMLVTRVMPAIASLGPNLNLAHFVDLLSWLSSSTRLVSYAW